MKRTGSLLVCLLAVAAAGRGQDYTLTPLPAVVEPDTLFHSYFTQPTITSLEGAVAVRIVDDFNSGTVYNGTISLSAPATIPDFSTITSLVTLRPPAVFTVRHTLAGVPTVKLAVVRPEVVSSAPDPFNLCLGGASSFPCNVDAIALRDGVASLSMNIELATPRGSRTGTLSVRVTFRWRVTAGCPAPAAASKGTALPQRNADGFCPSDVDLAIDHIEIVQSIQQYDPDSKADRVILVRGRMAFVRVFLRSVGQNAGELSGVNGQVQLGGGNGRLELRLKRVPVPRGREPVAPVGLPDTRTRRHSLDFVLTESQMRTSGDISVRADVWLEDARNQIISEKNGANNHLTINQPVPVASAWPDTFFIGVAPVCLAPGACPSVPRATRDLEGWFPARQTQIFPVHFPKVTASEEVFASADRMYSAIAELYLDYLKGRQLGEIFPVAAQPLADQIVFYVYAHGNPDAEKGAEQFFGVPGGLATFWLIRSESGSSFQEEFEHNVAHGVGHNLGLDHYDNASRIDSLSAGGPLPSGWRAQFASRTPYFDYDYEHQIPTVPRVSADQTLSRTLMDNVSGYNSWVSPGEFNSMFAKGPLKKPVEAPGQPPRETLVISGSVARDGLSGTLNTGVRGFSTIPTPPSDPGGDTCLQFLAAVTRTGDFCFAMASPPSLSTGLFAIATRFPPGTERVNLVHRGKELATLRAGTPPTVAIASPAGGETWQGVQKLRWTASGTLPEFIVQYSPDDGASWLPLSPTLRTNEFEFDTADVVGGEKVRFRVLASSGIDTSTATSAAIRVPQSTVLSLDVTEVRFTNLTNGEAEYRDIRVTNSGSGRLWAVATPPANPTFTLSGLTAGILGPGESLTIRVRFTPTASGIQQGVLRIGDKSVTLVGTGFADPAPSIETASQVDFEQVETGSTKDTALVIANTGEAVLSVSAIRVSGPGFSVVTPMPVTIEPGLSAEVMLRLTGAAAGAQSGQLTITSTDPTRGQLAVALVARGVAGALPAATSGGVTNAATFKAGPVAPGEIVTVFGANIGPAVLAKLRLDAQGKVATDLGGARVLFDGVPAPMIYAVAGQNAVVVPYAVEGRASTQMVVEYQGRQSNPVTVAVAASAPGLFSADASGTGPGAILNQNNTVNTPANPAAPGSVVVLYGTGEGQTRPGGVDGSVAATVFPKPILPVMVTIGGVTARVLYAGAAPNLVAGVLQVNAEIPAGLTAGNQPVVVTAGSASSQAGLTVAVGGTAPPPVAFISVTPSSLDFGTVTVGQSSTRTSTVRNTGTGPLNITFVSSSNAQFTPIDSFPPFTLQPGESRTMTFRFTPTAAGTPAGTIMIFSNDPARPSVPVSVSGVGAAASGGGGGTGGGGTPGPNLIQNPGAEVPPAPAPQGSCQAMPAIPAWTTDQKMMVCPYTISFLTPNAGLPANPGTYLFASGTGPGAEVRTLSQTIDLGSDKGGVGYTLGGWFGGYGGREDNARLKVTFRNAAGAALGSEVAGPVSVTDRSSQTRFLERTKTATLPAGTRTVLVEVIFTLVSAGNDAYADNLAFTLNDGSGGGGNTQGPVIAVEPTSLDFLTVSAGQTKDLALVVRNTGTAALAVTSTTSSNARFGSAIGAAAPNVVGSFYVGPGSFQNVVVRFSPTDASAQTGTLTLTTDDPARPTVQVPLSGNPGGGGGGIVCVAPPANQITWLSGNGNANDSAGSNNGTLLGGPTFVAGKVGQAFQFNGSSSYVSLGDPANLRLTSAISIEAWINPSAGPAAAGTLTAIVTKWGQVAANTSSSDSYGLWLERTAAGGIGLFAAVHQAADEPHASGGVIPLNTWTHVAMTFDSSTGRLTVYINGQAVSTVVSPGPVLATNRNVFIGREDSFLPRAFNGVIDEVGIYSRALSAAELQSIVTAGGNGKCSTSTGGGGGTLPTIAFGQTINGALTTSTPGRSVDCSTCYADTYQLTVTTARNVVITLNSTVFDAFLQIMDENRNILATNDDGGGGLNSRISGTIQPGVYRIEVTTANDFETGAYTLAIAP